MAKMAEMAETPVETPVEAPAETLLPGAEKAAAETAKTAEQLASERLTALRGLGAREKAEDYTIEVPETVPDGLREGPVLDWFKTAAVELGLLPDQVQAVYSGFVKVLSDHVAETEGLKAAAEAETITALQREWGPGFVPYLQAADRAATELGVTDDIRAAGLHVNIKFMTALARLGSTLGEAGTPPGRVGGQGLSREDAREKARQLNLDAVREPDQTKAAALAAEAARYYKIASGE